MEQIEWYFKYYNTFTCELSDRLICRMYETPAPGGVFNYRQMKAHATADGTTLKEKWVDGIPF